MMTKAQMRAIRWAITALCPPGERFCRTFRSRSLRRDGQNKTPYGAATAYNGHFASQYFAPTPELATYALFFALLSGDRLFRDDARHSETAQALALDIPRPPPLGSVINACAAIVCGLGREYPSVARLKRDIPQIQAELAAYALKEHHGT